MYVLEIDEEKGLIKIPFIEADHNAPVLDIKPYTPSLDRVENPAAPEWCSHWPKSSEDSGDFNWKKNFIFLYINISKNWYKMV